MATFLVWVVLAFCGFGGVGGGGVLSDSIRERVGVVAWRLFRLFG